MLLRAGGPRCCSVVDEIAADPCSFLAKEIWKASVRSVRHPQTWSNYAKQVVAQAPLLVPRDVATVVHSFARVKFKDEKTLTAIIPLILRNMDEFSAREIVHILSAFRKLEYARLDCLDLIVNQLVIKSKDWNEIDCALIANALGYFRIFEKSVWKCVESHLSKNREKFAPLGIGLIVGALAKLDSRNERLLRNLSRALTDTNGAGVMKQESFAIIMHGFYKLRWDEDFLLNQFFDSQLEIIFSEQDEFFDHQSLCMILHALFCYRLAGKQLSVDHTRLLRNGISKLLGNKEWNPNVDQLKRLGDICSLYTNAQEVSEEILLLKKFSGRGKHVICDKKKRSVKLPRWEYEIFRILKDKMQVPVKRRLRDKRTDIWIPPREEGGKDVVVLCLGPFQYYADSTKRTASSKLLRLTLEADGAQVMEIPFFIWNELKTDEDKIMYLYSLGRRAHPSSTSLD
jgi:hypothetical protein